jgi:hypothetical protein
MAASRSGAGARTSAHRDADAESRLAVQGAPLVTGDRGAAGAEQGRAQPLRARRRGRFAGGKNHVPRGIEQRQRRARPVQRQEAVHPVAERIAAAVLQRAGQRQRLQRHRVGGQQPGHVIGEGAGEVERLPGQRSARHPVFEVIGRQRNAEQRQHAQRHQQIEPHP